MRGLIPTALIALLFASHCGQRRPTPEHAAQPLAPAVMANTVVVFPAVADAAPPRSVDVFAGGTEEQYLAQGRDAAMPVGTRGIALQMYARKAREAGHGDQAARTIFALKGAIIGPLGDATYDAIAMTEAPSAIPLVLGTGELDRCEKADVPPERFTLDTLRKPDATVTLTLTEAFMTLATVFSLIASNPDSQEAAKAVPDMIRAMGCGDERIRHLAGQSVGNVHRLQPAESEALRELLLHEPRAHTRMLSATLLALAPEPVTITALEKALADGDELVQLAAAASLVRIHRPAKAQPVLRRLTKSRNQDVAATAKQVLAEKPKP